MFCLAEYLRRRDYQHHYEVLTPSLLFDRLEFLLISVQNHPTFWSAIHGLKEYVDMPNERFHPNYLLIKNPGASELTSPGLKAFTEEHNIHSILLVPLRVADVPRHLLTFYAADQKQSFHEDEIELLTFLGKEIMKASSLEFLSDVLHDFKNPAIAVAGFAPELIQDFVG